MQLCDTTAAVANKIVAGEHESMKIIALKTLTAQPGLPGDACICKQELQDTTAHHLCAKDATAT
jgi:hypothetical protein